MAIDINGNCVVFNGEALCSTPAGAEYGGVICHQGFVDTRVFQGTVSGYSAGGYGPGALDTIDKFPFTSDTNATDVGNIAGTYGTTGQSSETHGYASGGRRPACTNQIQKYPFASDTNSSVSALLTNPTDRGTGQSSKQNGFGYASGSLVPSPGGPTRDRIEKFSFANDTPAVAVGNLAIPGHEHAAGVSSTTNGYHVTGGPAPEAQVSITKFPFASDTNATDVAEFGPPAVCCGAGHSSETCGFVSGGAFPPSNRCDRIFRFTFASDGSAADVNELASGVSSHAGHSSVTDGYTGGGYGTPSRVDIIQKFPFTSSTPGSDIGDLTQVRRSASGTQV